MSWKKKLVQCWTLEKEQRAECFTYDRLPRTGCSEMCVCVWEQERDELCCSISWVQMCPWWFWLASMFCQEFQPGSLTQINTLQLAGPADAKMHSPFTSSALPSSSFEWIYAIIDLTYCIHTHTLHLGATWLHIEYVCEQPLVTAVWSGVRWSLESVCVGLFS